MDDDKMKGRPNKADAKLSKLRKGGIHAEVFSEELQRQVVELDDRELSALVAIKQKLNEGLDDRIKRLADTVGGFVW